MPFRQFLRFPSRRTHRGAMHKAPFLAPDAPGGTGVLVRLLVKPVPLRLREVT